MQTPLRQVLLVHADGGPHAPAALHVSTPLPTHWVAPGEHATQVLFRQVAVGLVHVSAVVQLPVASQDWMRLPRHRVAPSAHTPEHVPLMHVWPEHAAPLVHVPLALHVCGVLPLHCV